MKWEVDILVVYPTTVEVEADTQEEARERAMSGRGVERGGLVYSEAEIVDVRPLPMDYDEALADAAACGDGGKSSTPRQTP